MAHRGNAFRPDTAQDSAPITLGEALRVGARALAAAGVEAPRREARLLAAHLLGEPATALPDLARPVNAHAFTKLVARRAAHEPLAFITGRRGFWTLDLEVSPDTLIPRADSETLIEAALAARPDRRSVRRILDFGTGTGCLLLAAVQAFPNAFGIGVDLSPAAARLAARNAAANGLADRTAFFAGDWAAAIDARFDLVLCNPPYIETGALAGLMPEVGRHEPRLALDGGVSGLDAYARLVPALPALLAPAGLAVLELGAGQGQAVETLADAAGMAHDPARPDLAGIERALCLMCRTDRETGWLPMRS